MSAKKSRHWSFLVYEDSGDIKKTEEIILKTGYQAFRSPLHNKDTWTEDDEKENPEHVAGALKKPHYHVTILFPNPRAMKSVVELFKSVGVQYAEPVSSISGSYDYTTHKNSPDKYQYDEAPTTYNRFAISDYRPTSKADIRQRALMLVNYIRNYNITSITALMLGLLDFEADNQEERIQMFEYVQSNMLLANALIKDRREEEEYKNRREDTIRRKRVEDAIIKQAIESKNNGDDGLPF